MARTKAYLVVALATLLSMVGGLVAPVLSPATTAMAGTQTATALAMPAAVNSSATGVVTANDGTIFVWGDGDADAVADDYYFSVNGGASFTTVSGAGNPWDGTAITEIVISPTFGTDRNAFVAAGTATYRSTTGGIAASWALTGAGVAGGAINDLAIASNFSSGVGSIAWSFQGVVIAGNVQTSACTAAACAALANIDTAGAPAEATDGALGVEFSPNYISDGIIFAVLNDADGADTCPAAGACEARSTSGAAFGAPVAVTAAASAALGKASIAFPSGYNVASADNYFIASNLAGHSIYRRASGVWTDTQGAATPASSLAVSGAFASAILFAGVTAASAAPAQSQILRSNNGGVTWLPAILIGGSTGAVGVALSANFATDNTVYATTTGIQGGFWISTTGGGNSLAWSARGIYFDNFNTVVQLAGDPVDLNPLFAVINAAGANGALFRTTSGYAVGTPFRWTKNGYIAAGAVTAVGVSMNYATDSTVYLGGGAQLSKSTNGGQSFSAAFINPIPTGAITAGTGIVVANSNTVFVSAGATVHKTVDSGANWTSTILGGSPAITQVVLSPAFATDNTILVGARTPSGATQVYMSTDAGVTFTLVGTHGDTATAVGRVGVAFDNDYATNKVIYSVTDTDVYRWIVGTSTAWLQLSAGANVAGAAPAALPAGAADISAVRVLNGVLYGSSTTAAGAATGGYRRALNPDATYAGVTANEWFGLGWAPLGGVGISTAGTGLLNQGAVAGSTLALANAGMAVAPLTATTNLIVAVNNVAVPNVLTTYTDLLLEAPTPVFPANGATRATAPVLQWNPYGNLGTAAFTVRVSTSQDFSDVVNTSYTAVGVGTLTLAAPAVPAFAAGNTYYWAVRADANVARDAGSPWSATMSYGTAVGVAGLLTPVSAPGLTTVVPSKQITFNWAAVALATDYRIEISADGVIDSLSTVGAYRNPVITQLVGSASPSYTLTEAQAALLQDNTQYFWHVQTIFGTNAGVYNNLSAQAGASGFFRTPAGTTTTTSAQVALASLINTANPTASLLSIAWAQDTTTGEFMFLAPGVTSPLTTIQPNTALFLNLTASSRLRISGRDPITVPAGGRWIALGSSTLVELVP